MKKLSLPVIGMGVGAVLALGVGGALASGVIGGQVQPTSDESVYVAPSEEATPTAEPTPTAVVEAPGVEAPAPVDAPIEEPQAATVETVNEPAPQVPAADPAAEGIGTTGEDGFYTPAPPIQRAGEPPVAPYTPAPPAEKLPGEAGYVPPAPQG